MPHELVPVAGHHDGIAPPCVPMTNPIIDALQGSGTIDAKELKVAMRCAVMA